MTEAKQLAARLSEAQRADILASTEDYFWTADGRTMRAVKRKGLVADNDFRDMAYWTPLGLAVREVLTKAGANHAE